MEEINFLDKLNKWLLEGSYLFNNGNPITIEVQELSKETIAKYNEDFKKGLESYSYFIIDMSKTDEQAEFRVLQSAYGKIIIK